MTEGRYTECQNCKGVGYVWVTFHDPTLNREEVCHWCLGEGRVLNDFFVGPESVNNTPVTAVGEWADRYAIEWCNVCGKEINLLETQECKNCGNKDVIKINLDVNNTHGTLREML